MQVLLILEASNWSNKILAKVRKMNDETIKKLEEEYAPVDFQMNPQFDSLYEQEASAPFYWYLTFRNWHSSMGQISQVYSL